MSQLFDDILKLRKERKQKYNETQRFREEREQKNVSGELTAAEQREHGQMLDEVQNMTDRIESMERQLASEEKDLERQAKRRAGEASDAELRSLDDLNAEPRNDDFRLTALLRGYFNNDWSGSDQERRHLEERDVGISGSGSFVLGSSVFDQIYYSMINKMAATRAGAQTVRLDERGAETFKLPKLTDRPAASWKSENAQLSESDATFSSTEMKPKTLASFVKLSRELVQDSGIVEEALRQAYADSLSLELDRAALLGSGSDPEPQGISNAGVPTTDLSATLTVNSIMNAYYRLLDRNVDPNRVSMVMPTQAWRVLTSETFSDGRFVLAEGNKPHDWDKINFIASNQLPVVSGSPDSCQVIAGDFSNLIIGVRRQLEVDLSKEAGALSSYQFWSLAALRADIGVLWTDAFDLIDNAQLA
jgi:HK97 family phage major capsid protein